MTQGPSASTRLSSTRNTLPMGADRVARDAARPWYLWAAHAPNLPDGGPASGPGSEASPAPGHVFVLSAQRTHIGREAEAGVDLVLPDPAVSRRHAVVAAFPGEDTLWLQDCGSSNGVFLNGRKVEGAVVRQGDVIRIGDSVLIVGRGSPSPPEEARDLDIFGRSPAVAELRSIVRKVAPSALPVLIVGPTGTGKELVARAVHEQSGRRGRVVAVNCAALPATLVESVLFGHKKGAYTGAIADQEGAFVQAHLGTLFLDEVGDLALEAQPKLLRALENGEVTPIGTTHPLAVDVRVVAATHVPLDAALEAGRFRRDLYARLAGVVVRTPALADRREDVLLLLDAFLGEAAARSSPGAPGGQAPLPPGPRPMSADFVERLLGYAWPFNVRELKKLAERLVVLHAEAPRYELGMLDDEMRVTGGAPADARAEHALAPGPASQDAVGAWSSRGTTPPAPREGVPGRDELIALLERCDGNVSKVAELVQRNRKQVYRWMKQREVEPGTGRKE